MKLAIMEPDDLPVRRDDPLAQMIRQDLDPLSVDELHARIALLKAEIARCESKMAAASAFRSHADSLFRPRS